jgi:PleD family two-component response regulator
VQSPRRADVPKWDLVPCPAGTNSRWAMEVSPFPPIPQPLRSGDAHHPRSASDTTPIRVLIGDSDGEFRHALRTSFAADPRIEVVGEADDGQLALDLLRCLRPDVALIDEEMPSFGGAAIARVLRSELAETRVVVMTRRTTGVH